MTHRNAEVNTNKRVHTRKRLPFSEEMKHLPKAAVVGVVVLVFGLIAAPILKLSGKVKDAHLEGEARRVRRKVARKKD